MKQLFWKGYSLTFRLFVALICAVGLISADINYHAFTIVRSYLDTFISPLYYLSNTPRVTFETLTELSKSKQTIETENFQLKNELLQLQNDLLLLNNLKHENDSLRKLLDSPLRQDEYKKVAQVLLTDTDPYVYQVVLNRGEQDKVYVGQPVVDEKGVVGQIYKTAQNTSRAILICDYHHAIPVKIVRNDISMIAVGNGCNNDLSLDFLPNNIDIEVGDTLVTSGLDGRFPEGYPVATVSSVKLDKNEAIPIISATPTADLKRLRYLLLLWSDVNKQLTGPALPQEISNE